MAVCLHIHDWLCWEFLGLTLVSRSPLASSLSSSSPSFCACHPRAVVLYHLCDHLRAMFGSSTLFSAASRLLDLLIASTKRLVLVEALSTAYVMQSRILSLACLERTMRREI